MNCDTTDVNLYHVRDISRGLVRTGYYSKAKNYSNPVCISRIPKGDFPELQELAPPAEIMNRYKFIDKDEKAYALAYTAYLDSVDWTSLCAKVMDMIKRFGPVTLLCYEKQGDFCHRHAAAARLGRELVRKGFVKPEDMAEPDEEDKNEEKDLQPSLFG